MNRFTKVLIASLSLITAFEVYAIISACIGEPEVKSFADFFSLTSDEPISLWDSIFYAKEEIAFILLISVLLFLKIAKRKNTNLISFVLIACFLVAEIWGYLELYLFIYPEILEQSGIEKLLSLKSVLRLSIFTGVLVLLFSFIKDLQKDEKKYFLTLQKGQMRIPAFWVLAQLIPLLLLHLDVSHLIFSFIDLLIWSTLILISFGMIYEGKTAFLFAGTIVLAFVSVENIQEIYPVFRYGFQFSMNDPVTLDVLHYILNTVLHIAGTIILYCFAKKTMNGLNPAKI